MARTYGLYFGNLHSECGKNGCGIKQKVSETGETIEVEGGEWWIPKHIFESSDKHSFKGKTNAQILKAITNKYDKTKVSGIVNAGDFIVMRSVVNDRKKYDREGTVSEIVNQMQSEHGGKNSSNYKFKEGGVINRIYLGQDGGSNVSTSFDRAVLLEKQGVEKQLIRLSTGWFRNPFDNLWRYEISDENAIIDNSLLDSYCNEIKGTKKRISKNLSEFYHNEQLYKAYPNIKNISVVFIYDENDCDTASVITSVDNSQMWILIKYNFYAESEHNSITRQLGRLRGRKSIFTHELQHVVQIREGHSGGSSKIQEFKRLLEQKQREDKSGKMGHYSESILRDESTKRYNNSAGEIEATDSENRMEYIDFRRYIAIPYSSIKYDNDSVIVDMERKIEFEDGGLINRIYLGQDGGSNVSTSFDRAVSLSKIGATNEQIRHLTGWFRNPFDKLWRYEISDEYSKIDSVKLDEISKKIESNQSQWIQVLLSDIYSNDILFKAYPEIKNIRVYFVWQSNFGIASVIIPEEFNEPIIKYNFYAEQSNSSTTGNRNDNEVGRIRKGVFTHELQHVVQIREGHGGGSSAIWEYGKLLENFQRENPDMEVSDNIKSSLYREATERLKNSSGEIEARSAEQRIEYNEIRRSIAIPYKEVSFDKNNVAVNLEKKRNFNEGGGIESTHKLTMYQVIQSADTWTENKYFGIDYVEAKKEFDSPDIHEKKDTTYIIEKREDRYEFVGDWKESDYDSQEEMMLVYPLEDDYEDESVWKLVDEGEWEVIDSVDVQSLENKNRDEESKKEESLKEIIRSYIFDISTEWKEAAYLGSTFYALIPYKDGNIQVRLADHFHNPSNVNLGREILWDYYEGQEHLNIYKNIYGFLSISITDSNYKDKHGFYANHKQRVSNMDYSGLVRYITYDLTRIDDVEDVDFKGDINEGIDEIKSEIDGAMEGGMFTEENPTVDYEKGGSISELSKGTNVEMEHLDTIHKFKRKGAKDKEIAESIAKDHLQEDSQYYTKLAEMETKFKKGGEVAPENTKIDSWDKIPDEWKKYPKLKYVNPEIVNHVHHLDDFKDIAYLTKGFIGNDALRPQFSGVFFNKDGHVVATNTHIMLCIPYKGKREGLYIASKSKSHGYDMGDKIDHIYPQYEQVIPKYERYDFKISVSKLLQYCHVAKRFANRTSFASVFKYKSDVNVGFNIKLLIDTLNFWTKIGVETVYCYQSSPSRPLVLSNDKEFNKDSSIVTITMPIYLENNTELGTGDIDFNTELSVYYDFSQDKIISRKKSNSDKEEIEWAIDFLDSYDADKSELEDVNFAKDYLRKLLTEI